MKRRIGIVAGAVVATIAIAGAGWTVAKAVEIKSGIPVGGLLVEFRALHLSGPDKGTGDCPVCKYQTNPSVQAWINGDDPGNVAALTTDLEKELAENANKKPKAFVVFQNPSRERILPEARKFADFAIANNLKRVSVLGMWNGPQNQRAIDDNEINAEPKIKNTVFVYKARKVSAKFVNLVADAKGLAKLNAAIERQIQQP